MGKIKKILSLYALYARMDLRWLLRDSVFALTAIFADFISNLSGIIAVYLLAIRFDGIGGMSRDEVLFMLSYTTLVTGLYQLFFSANNTGHISRRIGRGQLDHMLLQPLPLPVQLLAEGFIPFSGAGTLLPGAALTFYAVSKLGLAVSPLWCLRLAASLVCTMAILVASMYLFSCAAFYAPVQAEEISSYLLDAHSELSQFPLSGMPRAAQAAFITVMPSGLLGWFPSLSLLGRTPLGLAEWYPALFAAALSSAAIYFFRKGLKYYVKKGVNRYLSFGHRR